MDNQGWIKLYRKLLDNEMWLQEKFNRSHAWIDLILIANHKDATINVRGNIIPIKRGQVGWSERSLAHRWKWSRNRVRSFLEYLQIKQQIIQEKSHTTSVITIINYEKYQEKRPQTVPQEEKGQKTIPQTVPQTVPQKDLILNTIQQKTDSSYDAKHEKLDTNKNKKNINNIYIRYKEKINSGSRLTESSRKKIISRLKTFSELELLKAIDNFAGDNWWMENNAHRGVAWFFNSDDRIDQFLNLKGKSQVGGFNPLELPLL